MDLIAKIMKMKCEPCQATSLPQIKLGRNSLSQETWKETRNRRVENSPFNETRGRRFAVKKRSTRSGSCHALGPCGVGCGTRNNEDSHAVRQNKTQMFPINSLYEIRFHMKPWRNMPDKIIKHGWLSLPSSPHHFDFTVTVRSLSPSSVERLDEQNI